LKSAQALAEKEQGTSRGMREARGSEFGIFDTFADEKGREAHLTGDREGAVRESAGVVCEGAGGA